MVMMSRSTEKASGVRFECERLEKLKKDGEYKEKEDCDEDEDEEFSRRRSEHVEIAMKWLQTSVFLNKN
jgi:hypothetical protein